MKNYVDFILEKNGKNPDEKIEQLKKYVLDYYNKVNHIDYSNSIEIEYDKNFDLYKIWVKPYSSTELFKDKTGGSESHPKDKECYYDYIILSNELKNSDPAGWIEHEIGHILGFRKGYNNKKGNIIEPKEVYGLDHYPNVWSEFLPFTRQMTYLTNKGNKLNDVIRNMMKDYETSESHKGNNESLKQIEEFFIKFLEKFVIKKDSGLKNKYIQ